MLTSTSTLDHGPPSEAKRPGQLKIMVKRAANSSVVWDQPIKQPLNWKHADLVPIYEFLRSAVENGTFRPTFPLEHPACPTDRNQ